MMTAALLVLFATQVGLVGAAGKEVIVVARLRDTGTHTPDCGVFHFAAVMKYEVLRVVKGEYQGSLLYAIHGCPELTRVEYGAEAGTLKRFKVGEVHKLFLWPKAPAGDAAVVDGFKAAEGARYWVRRVDPASEKEVKRP